MNKKIGFTKEDVWAGISIALALSGISASALHFPIITGPLAIIFAYISKKKGSRFWSTGVFLGVLSIIIYVYILFKHLI